jgi:FlaA1/EpsC-like NDP-sugar epimerase
MGEPVRIGDLADRVMALEQAAGSARVPTDIVGLRAGEKLREELTTQGLRMCPTRHRRIWVARQRPDAPSAIVQAIRALRGAIARGDSLSALDAIARAVPEFEVSADARQSARAQSLCASGPAGRRVARVA